MARRPTRGRSDPLSTLVGGSAHPTRIATQRVLAPAKFEAMARLEEAELEMQYLRELGAAQRNRSLQEIEDRRRHQPRGIINTPPKSIIGSKYRLIMPAERRDYLLQFGNEIGLPHDPKDKHQLAMCIRRKARREVLFAIRKNKKGSKSRRRRKNPWSDIKC